jgi:preprotein translocase subunit SecA
MYAERDKVIERDDVHDIVKEFFKRVAVRYVKDCVYYVDKDEVVDLDQLEKKFVPQFLTPEEFNKDSLKRLERDDVIDKMIEALVTKEEARGATWGGNIFQMVEKQVLTKVIDTNWTNHIDQMSRLRDGIGLRSYAQTNPLQSYIHEGYDMFNKMMHKIAEQTATYLLNVQVKIEKKEPEQEASDQEAAKN